jgi:tetratricopeptide (TPR) repeat protein
VDNNISRARKRAARSNSLSSKRPVILMTILLALLAGYFSQAWWKPLAAGTAQPPVTGYLAPPLPGENKLTGLRVSQDPQGDWYADFDYFFTGQPNATVLAETLENATLPIAVGIAPNRVFRTQSQLSPGAHHGRIALAQQGDGVGAMTTQAVEIRMIALQGSATLASQRLEQRIDWPDWQTRTLDQEVNKQSEDAVMKSAIALIDQGRSNTIQHARQLLERLLVRNPKNKQAYLELARIAMKTNWGPEGLHQAETLIDSALQIHPDDINARVLLAYVESHQKRYGASESLSEALDKENPPNLWLWWNWGEMLEAQGQMSLAIQKYRTTLAHPVSHDTYDRAREAAYHSLLRLLGAAHDRDGMEALYRQRLVDYGANGCNAVAYAGFLVKERGDPTAAIAVARPTLSATCDEDGLTSRSVLGMAYYLEWATSVSADRGADLNQARIYLPVGAESLYLLASSERTAPAVRALVKQGESIDQRDNQKLDALALALSRRDVATARRLLGLGAHADALVSESEIPVAFIPLLTEDMPCIQLMQKSGIDYAKLRVGGASALDQARRSGHAGLADRLDLKARPL